MISTNESTVSLLISTNESGALYLSAASQESHGWTELQAGLQVPLVHQPPGLTLLHTDCQPESALTSSSLLNINPDDFPVFSTWQISQQSPSLHLPSPLYLSLMFKEVGFDSQLFQPV